MSSEVLQPPEWEEGNDLTVKVGADGKPRQAATFFALFERKKGALRLAFNIPGEGPQSLAEAVRMEEILVNEIQVRVACAGPIDPLSDHDKARTWMHLPLSLLIDRC